MDLKSIKVVSWDVDGTLYSFSDFMKALKVYLIRGFFSLRCWTVVWDFLHLVRFKMYMDRVRHQEGDYHIQGPVPGRERIAAAQHRIYAAILPELGLPKGVQELLHAFAQQGIRQVVLSDYLPTGKLVALGVDDMFDRVFTGEEYDHLKPAPVVFEEMIEELGIQPHELLHIGDREDTDGGAVDEVGYRVVVIGRDVESADEIMDFLAFGGPE